MRTTKLVATILSCKFDCLRAFSVNHQLNCDLTHPYLDAKLSCPPWQGMTTKFGSLIIYVVSQLMIPFMFSRFPRLFLQNFHLLFISQFLSFILTDDDSKCLRICINNISSFRVYKFLALLDQQMNLNQNYHVEFTENWSKIGFWLKIGFWPKLDFWLRVVSWFKITFWLFVLDLK